MKKLALFLCAALIAAFALAGCGSSQPTYAVSDGVISPNGNYTVEASLEGGSGKATIQSPVPVKVAEGTMTATFVWSSSNYDLMVVDGTEYKPTSTKDGSTFEIPVKSIDGPLSVQAETTAMGTPHMIEYTINFDPSKVKAAK